MILDKLKENYQAAKAELKGEARSHARIIKNAVNVPGLATELRKGPPARIPGAFVRMKDGVPMQFCTDGSIRHAFGKNVSKAAKKRAKKARRADAKARAAGSSVVKG